MRKTSKKAFTLAQVLLVIVIMGITMAMTIPSTIIKIQDVDLKTKLKSEYSILSEVIGRLLDNAGGTFDGNFTNSMDMANKFASLMNTVKQCNTNASTEGCWHSSSTWKGLDGSSNSLTLTSSPGFILQDGTLLVFNNDFFSATCTDAQNTIPKCGSIYIDINGFRFPNQLGRDIYQFWITSSDIVPLSVTDPFQTPDASWTCDSSHPGWACSGYYLQGN